MDQVNARGFMTTLIHYVYQSTPAPERIACMPNMTEFHLTANHPNYQRSNATGAVTCPACMKSEAYKQARGRNG